MTDREMDQARLLDSYWTALAHDPNAAVPDGLDAATAETTRRLCLEISSTEPEPAFTSTLRRTLQVRAAEMASRPRAVSAPIGRRFNLGGFVRRLSAVAAAVLVLIVAGFFAVGVAASGLEQPSAVSFSPTALKDVPANAPVSITFDRPMLGPLAERALRIEPAVEGSFSWKGNTMQFTPRTGWSRETVYTVSLDQGARGMLLLPLKSPVHYEFMTAKDLTVLSVQPGDGATNVDPSNGIVAQFNYPIVPLGAAGQGPNPLVIEPAVPGRGKWVTTSLYMYQPDGGLASGVTYRVTVPKGLQDTGGGKLAADYGWSFTTKAPSVGMVSPEANTRFAGPRQEVRVTFDQPVDHASAESRFSLKSPAGDAVPGSISWDGEVMVFKPSAPLKLDTQYTATVASGVAATKGGGLSEAFSWRFTTVGAPRVTSTTPAQGAQLPPYDAVQIQFSNPMDHDAVEKAISISPQPPQKWRTSWQESDTKAFVLGGLKPSTSYTLTIGADAADRYGQRLGAPVKIKFATAALPPRANPLIPGIVGTFNAAGAPTLYVEHLNVAQIDLALYKLDFPTFARLAWDGKGRNDFKPAESSLVRRWSEKTTPAERNESAVTPVTLSGSADKKLQSGYYYLKMQGPGIPPSDRLLTVSRLSLTMKRSQDQVLVWATDIVSGEVVRDLPLRITDRDGNTLVTGRTDRDGLWRGNDPRLRINPSQYSEIYATSDADGDAGAVNSAWADGIRPYEFNIPYDVFTQPYRGYMYTDRPIYRPGQKVEYKGVVRSDDDGRYAVPKQGSQLTVDIMDFQGRKLRSDALQLSEMGTLAGEFVLPTDAAVGMYNIAVRLDQWSLARQFSVAEYRKPEFDVKLSTDRKSYVHGDTISVSGSAAYYFGQPLANATVKWRIFSRDYLFNGDGGYQFVDGDILSAQHGSEEKKRTEGEATADAQGNFTFTVPADLTQDVVGQLFTVEATITDATNQEVSSRTDAVVHKGAIYAGLRPEKYVVRTGDPAVVNVLALDEDGKPAAGARVTVSFFNRKWNSVKERQPDGGYVWSSKPEDTLITSSEVTVDSAGKGTARIEPKTAGTIRVTAEVSDPRGNKNRSATNLYASGSGVAAWRMESTSRVDLVPDKKEYQVGDTARVLIPSPIQDALALVTVERGRVLTSQVIRLNGNSETIEVPIQADFLPNVFVSVVLFKGSGPSSSLASFRVGYGELKVSPTGKALKVTLTPDKPKYQPGEKATYTIRTADSSGKGVPAEVSLAVVDASVLALADETTDDPMKLFWGRRTLATGTSATLSQSVDLFNADLSVQRKGAGGGGNQPTVRREFPDTAYWNPSIRTDDKGEATVAVTMPDSLTTWKATARAVTAATQFGSATAETVVSKDLLLRPAFPRFMLMGDHLTLTALLSNYTGRDIEAEVGLTASGVQPEKDGAFAPQRVRVAAGAAEKVEWPAKVDTVAADGAKATLKLDARVLAGDGGDSVEITLPVKALSAAEVVATSGEVRDSTTELVRLPDGINSSLGELTIETSPSLAAGMRYSARYLAEFPWECTEQTVSRFLPRIVMQRAFDKLKLPDTEGIAAGLPATVTRGIQTLYTSQRPDGGWGWWPSDPSDQWISAYAVQGLAEAARSGYTVDPGVIERATQYLRRTLDISYDTEHPENLNSRAYVLYVLAAAGKGEVGLTNSLYERRSALGNYGKAYLLLALNSLGAGTSDSKLKSLASDLSSAAVTSAAGAHWEESQPDYRAMNTSTRSTAIVLDALVRTFPDNQWIQPAVRWLMVARKDGHWETTQETAWSLLALTDFLQASGELAADFAYRVQVNGSEQSTDAVKSDALDQTRTLVIKVKDLLQGADNSVNIARAKPDQSQGGAGKLYYTMALRYFLPGEQVEALSQGLAVAREYYRQGDEAAGPVTQVKPGETVKVKLTLVALQDLHYVALDDPLPAGLEAVDTRLKTTSIAARADTGGVRKDDPSFNPKAVAAKPLPVFEWWKYNYFGHVEPRDDRVALFANFLPKGTYEYTYLAKATTSGEFQILPAQAYEMYFPDVSGRSYGGKLTVAP